MENIIQSIRANHEPRYIHYCIKVLNQTITTLCFLSHRKMNSLHFIRSNITTFFQVLPLGLSTTINLNRDVSFSPAPLLGMHLRCPNHLKQVPLDLSTHF
eukprot:TRINITY_DN16279_c1_g1_i1.p1 TRINITY_DN16279_c1_g1~~TRINITY_DN16279_c1_g1_i1.p1  ORF type:complete len:100 (-),score=2.96 TRINITY_DN16279_c1_g1_i1:388-687(-)